MNKKDMATLGVAESGRVTVKNATGTMTTQKPVAYPIKEGNIIM
jgi:hypothetical protein